MVCEWRKLFRLPALWVFLALCLAFNTLLILEHSSGRDFFRDVSAVAKDLGQQVTPSFLEGLSRRGAGESRDILIASTAALEDIFETYDTGELEAFYKGVVSSSPLAARWMEWKYGLLSGRVAHLAAKDAALTLYAGPITHDSHQFLFSTLLRSVVAEGAILSMLATLYLLGYERMFRTESLIFTARTGRALRRIKVLSALPASLVLYALLAVGSLCPYFALWDYGGVWSASVSSQFNYLTDMLYSRPFLTWGDFTVAGYLAAALALGAALCAAFALLAAVCGILIRNTYGAALALILLCASGLSLTVLLAQAKLWPLYFLSCFQPAGVWLCIGGWFTELGLSAAIPWQETVSTLWSLLLAGASAALALRQTNRKDLL